MQRPTLAQKIEDGVRGAKDLYPCRVVLFHVLKFLKSDIRQTLLFVRWFLRGTFPGKAAL
jgi:hypothetical protein